MKVLRLLLACVTLLPAFACGGGSREEQPTQSRTVTAYVSTDRVFSEPVLRAFEQHTGVRVNAVYDTEETKSTGLANRLLAERDRAQADVFWSNEPVRTLVLKSRGVLAPYESPSARDIPQTFKDPQGYWTAFSAYGSSRTGHRVQHNTRSGRVAACSRSLHRCSILPIRNGKGRPRLPILDSGRGRSTLPLFT